MLLAAMILLQHLIDRGRLLLICLLLNWNDSYTNGARGPAHNISAGVPWFEPLASIVIISLTSMLVIHA